MPKGQRYNPVRTALKALLVFFCSAFLTFAAAATLGPLTVLSSLGQPLNAQVEIVSVAPEEAESLAVRLAPAAAFRKSGIEYSPLLQSLVISLEKRGERYFVRIRTHLPINEPYMGLLLELAVNQERKGREYGIVLDPAEWTNLRSAPLSSAADSGQQARQQWTGNVSRPPRSRPNTVRPADLFGAEGGEAAPRQDYVVVRGDTLSKVAQRYGNSDASLEQMLVVLFRNNPTAFRNGNMNWLKEGAVLTIPPGQEAADLPQREARRTVRLHASNFNQYSQRLAGLVEKSLPDESVKRGTADQGKVTAKVQEQPTPASTSPDRLELSKAPPGTVVKPVITLEEKIAINRSLEDANARITELEKNVNELRKLLEVASQRGHEISQTAVSQDSKVEPAPEAATAEPEGKTESGPDETPAPSEAETGKAAPAEGETLAVTEKPVKEIEPPVEPAKSTEDDDDEPAEQSFLDKLKNNLLWQVAIGVGAALLFLIIFIIAMSRKKSAAATAKPAPASRQPREKETVEENPSIISGQDYLDNLSGRDLMDEDEFDYDGDDAPAETPIEDAIKMDDIADFQNRLNEMQAQVAAEEAADRETQPLELDLSDINLDPDAAVDSGMPASGGDAQLAEMAAKLELAKAYIDMKDIEGARELLDEVVIRGSSAQVTEAQQLLGTL